MGCLEVAREINVCHMDYLIWKRKKQGDLIVRFCITAQARSNCLRSALFPKWHFGRKLMTELAFPEMISLELFRQIISAELCTVRGLGKINKIMTQKQIENQRKEFKGINF